MFYKFSGLTKELLVLSSIRAFCTETNCALKMPQAVLLSTTQIPVIKTREHSLVIITANFRTLTGVVLDYSCVFGNMCAHRLAQMSPDFENSPTPASIILYAPCREGFIFIIKEQLSLLIP